MVQQLMHIQKLFEVIILLKEYKDYNIKMYSVIFNQLQSLE